MKRAFDLAFAISALVVLSPVMAALALVIRWKLGRPVLFRQKRPGMHGRPFELVKFRTMTHDTDSSGTPLSDEVRLTAFGRFVRSTSLDELPEFWNVLKGDMSIVGPRPLLMEYLPLYDETQARRHEVKPGITGWAQVNGRNAVSWDRRFALDVWYVDHRTLALDLKILWLTLWKVVSQSGISEPGGTTMSKFTGSSR